MISYKNRIKKTKTSSFSFLPYNTTSSLALTMVYGRTNYMKYDDSFPKSIFFKTFANELCALWFAHH